MNRLMMSRMAGGRSHDRRGSTSSSGSGGRKISSRQPPQSPLAHASSNSIAPDAEIVPKRKPFLNQDSLDIPEVMTAADIRTKRKALRPQTSLNLDDGPPKVTENNLRPVNSYIHFIDEDEKFATAIEDPGKSRKSSMRFGSMRVPLAYLKEFMEYYDAERALKAERRRLLKEKVKEHLKKFWPAYGFLTLIFGGMFIFWVLETFIPVEVDSRVKSEDGCIGKNGFMGYLFFTLSATTTIGFGTIYPCNIVSRVFGIFYCLLGIPVTLVILTRVGDIVCKFVHAVHMRMPPRTIPEDSEEEEDGDDSPVPVSLGIAFILIFVLLSAFYYMVIEHYAASESVYYAFYTLIAGDLQVKQLKYSLFIFVIVILGFGMVATTYDIIQLNIMNMTRKMEKDIKKLQDAILSGEIDTTDQSPDDMIAELMNKNAPGWMKMAMTNSQMEQIVDTSASVIEKTMAAVGDSTVSTQVDPTHFFTFADTGSQCEKMVHKEERTIQRSDTQTQIGASFKDYNQANVGTDHRKTSNVGVETHKIEINHRGSLTDRPERKTSSIHTQANPTEWYSKQDSYTQSIVAELVTSEVQTILHMMDQYLQTEPTVTIDQIVQTLPSSCNHKQLQCQPTMATTQLQTVSKMMIDRRIQTLLRRLENVQSQTEPTNVKNKIEDTFDLIELRDARVGVDQLPVTSKQTDTVDLLNYVMRDRPPARRISTANLPISYKY